MPAHNDKCLAFCRYCHRNICIKAGKYDLIKHFNTTKHDKHSKKAKLQSNLIVDEKIESSLVETNDSSSVSSGTQNNSFISVTIPITGQTYNYPLQSGSASPKVITNKYIMFN